MVYDPSIGQSRDDLSDFSEVIEFTQLCIGKNDDTAFIVWDAKQKVVGVSQSINNKIGLTPDQLYGAKWKKSLTTEVLDSIQMFLFKSSDSNYESSFNIQFEQKNIKFLLKTIEFKKEKYYICRLEDLSYVQGLKQTIQQLEDKIIHAEKMAITGEFAASLIHEIRNPLTSIKGFLQLVQAGIEQKDEYYRVMIDEVEKIEHITNELLMVSKPLVKENNHISLVKLIKDTIVIMKLQQTFEKVEFKFNYAKDCFINCNKQQIKQVLINLFKNAAEAMKKQGTIQINLEEQSQFIKLAIVDGGEGVSDDVILEINKPFYTTKKTGTGLGLVVTNKILKQHGAFMDICSKKGIGSKFTIYFPKPEDLN